MSDLLPWNTVAEKLPPKGCAVLVDGDEWHTYMVAIYIPSDTAYPWKVYSGHEADRYALDAFEAWTDLPVRPAR